MIIKNAHNVARYLRIKYGTARLSGICKADGIKIVPYSAGWEIIKKLDLVDRARESDGLSNIIEGRRVIFYNDSLSCEDQRFTVAHELGHHMLGHTLSGNCRYNAAYEREADAFASSLLTPACAE